MSEGWRPLTLEESIARYAADGYDDDFIYARLEPWQRIDGPAGLRRLIQEVRRSHEPLHPERSPGRPKGSGRVGPTSREDITTAHASWRRTHDGRRPTQSELARTLDCGVRTLQSRLADWEMGWPLRE